MSDSACGNLEGYLAKSLPEEERVAFEAHLVQCPACQEEVRRQREIDQLLGEATRELEPAPPGLVERIDRGIASARGRRLVLATGGLSAAAALLVIVFVHFGGRGVVPEDRVRTQPQPVSITPELTPIQQLAVWMGRRPGAAAAPEHPRVAVPVFAPPGRWARPEYVRTALPASQETAKQEPKGKQVPVVRGKEPFNARAIGLSRSLAERRLEGLVPAGSVKLGES